MSAKTAERPFVLDKIISWQEGFTGDGSIGSKLYDFSFLHIDHLISQYFQTSVEDRMMHDSFGRCIDIKTDFRKVQEVQRRAAFDKPDRICSIQNREGLIAKNRFCHRTDRREIQCFFRFDQLHGNVGIGFNFGIRKMLFEAQGVVIIENAVVC